MNDTTIERIPKRLLIFPYYLAVGSVRPGSYVMGFAALPTAEAKYFVWTATRTALQAQCAIADLRQVRVRDRHLVTYPKEVIRQVLPDYRDYRWTSRFVVYDEAKHPPLPEKGEDRYDWHEVDWYLVVALPHREGQSSVQVFWAGWDPVEKLDFFIPGTEFSVLERALEDCNEREPSGKDLPCTQAQVP